MANIQYKNGSGAITYTSADGAGTDADPQIPKSKILELPTGTETKLTAIRDRLIEIAGSVDGLEGLITSLNGYVDGLEGLTGTTNTTLTTLNSYVDQLEGYTDQLEGLLNFSKGAGTIDANTLRIAIAIGQTLNVGGNTVAVSNEFTRPADTTAYAIDDVVSNSTTTTTPLVFTNAARAEGGSGYITTARMAKSSSGITSASFRLWLYRSTPTSPPVDNAAFALLWANRANRIGSIDFTLTTAATGSDSASALVTGLNIPFQLNSGRDLAGILTARAAYPPVSAESFFIELGVEQN